MPDHAASRPTDFTQAKHPTPGLDLAATHLNASVGPMVSATHIATALRAGSLAPLAEEPTVQALVSYLFTELEPPLIVQCAVEAGTHLIQANQLYLDTLRSQAPRSPTWEQDLDPFVDWPSSFQHMPDPEGDVATPPHHLC